ncbi:hypothetical protein GF339_22215 [candidate division KSB3 bacterium]|uniref:HTH cro/C1-type domain-containing protein n=1 Tax=candidate division KSB3 bacterium TaxID=2044937 RepID=A0A9D5JZT7_9BACT|nr:hypothetical protein [candidate division KSB3 bacterium]MBD3327317.1 hypothetical protein [candidate division KSB3 bacterium]
MRFDMQFGESLRKERELRGITIEEISQHTKVHHRFLEAIENDDLSALPAKAFAKGFLRSYARMVGLDEDEVITNFEYSHRSLHKKNSAGQLTQRASSRSRNRLFLLTMLLIIVLFIAILIMLYAQGIVHLEWLGSFMG